jgi:hypothetical protein
MSNFERLALPALAVAAFIAATPVQASTLIADGITYSLTATSLNATTNEFTLLITGINAAADTEKGRSGVNGIAFSLPSNFASAVMITPALTFIEQDGGLNSSGCNGNGNFFCFKAKTTPASLPGLAADSSLTFVFDVTLSSGTFAGYSPDFKIDWIGSKNNYDLVSAQLDPTLTQTPIPGALPLFAGGGGLLGFLSWRRKRKNAAVPA